MNAAPSRVVAVLDEHSVAPADRQTRRLSLRAHYEAAPGAMTATLVGYQASIGLRVQLVELAEVPWVLEALVAAGGEPGVAAEGGPVKARGADISSR